MGSDSDEGASASGSPGVDFVETAAPALPVASEQSDSDSEGFRVRDGWSRAAAFRLSEALEAQRVGRY